MMQAKIKSLILALLVIPSFVQAHTVVLEINRGIQWPVSVGPFGEMGEAISATLLDKGKAHSLLTHVGWNVSKDATKLVITLKDGPNTEVLKLPARVEQRLLQFFIEKPTKRSCTKNSFAPYPDTYFECTSFVHYVHDIDIEKLSHPIGLHKFRFDPNSIFKYWELSPYQKSSLRPGDVIALDGPLGNHFALYLGHDLYISKFGEGPVWVSELSAFRVAYHYTDITTFKPLQRPAWGNMIANFPSPALTCAGIGLACALITYLN